MNLRMLSFAAAVCAAAVTVAAPARVVRDIPYDPALGADGLGDLYLPDSEREGLARRGTTGDISAIAIVTGGVTGLDPWDLYDRGRVLLDNVVVTVAPSGTYIIVR